MMIKSSFTVGVEKEVNRRWNSHRNKAGGTSGITKEAGWIGFSKNRLEDRLVGLRKTTTKRSY